jgi:4-hydroxy-3-methylbut-2-enyl diphosphate reductase
MAGMQVLLANPRGFCAGVDRAIEIVDRLLDAFGAPIYVRHEVVHNRFVVDGLRKRGAIFVDELDEVPDGATVVFSAHGVSQTVRTEGGKRGLQVFDATCPLVTKVHIEVAQHCRAGRDVLMIGHAGHPEVEGTLGQWDGANPQGATIQLIETVEDAEQVAIRDPERLAFVTQTTLSVDDTREIIAALQQRFPGIAGPRRDDICYATQNRQDAVRRLAAHCDLVLVVGSPNSSNSNRLRELSEKAGVPSFLIDGAQDVRPEWLAGRQRIGLTAGASAPESLVKDVVARLRSLGADSVEELDGKPEDIVFALPKELRVRLA